MTNKEASDILDDYDVNFEGHTAREVAEAFDCAFKALDQEPCDDAISRQAVKEQMIKYGFHAPDMTVTEFVEELPPVTTQPKTGRWISHGEHCKNLGVIPSGLGAYKWCSNCDCGIDVSEWHRNNYNFCPNCGAKMVEPQESEG